MRLYSFRTKRETVDFALRRALDPTYLPGLKRVGAVRTARRMTRETPG